MYDGEKHDCDAVDAVKIGRTNIYVLEYIDHNLNKRSRCLVQKGKERVSHIPLYDKTGLNKTFDYWKQHGQTASVDEIFKYDKEIGVTSSYANLDAFMAKIEEKKTEEKKTEETKPRMTAGQLQKQINDEYQEAVKKAYEDPIVVKESVLTTISNGLDNIPDVPETEVEPSMVDISLFTSKPTSVVTVQDGAYTKQIVYPNGNIPSGGPMGGRPPMGGPRPMPPEDGPRGPRK